MNTEIAALLVATRARELRARADLDRLVPGRPREPALMAAVRRCYARLWWAARPRAAAWIPGLLGR